MFWLALLMVAALGYANQRGSTCAVAAADEIIERRSFHRLAGFLVAGTVSAAILLGLGGAPRAVAVPGWGAVVGGMVGGLGASLNGRCAMGTIASLGRGRIDRLATLAGFLVGSAIVLRGLGWAPGTAMHAPLQSWPLAAGALGLAVLAWRLACSRALATPGWMALIGLLNAVLVWLMVNWSYTGGLTRLAAGQTGDLANMAAFLGVLIAGSVCAAILAGTFKRQSSSWRDWLRSACGGLLLGMGSAIVPGSNDAMLLLGLPLLVPGLLIAYAAFWLSLIVARFVRFKQLTKDADLATA